MNQYYYCMIVEKGVETRIRWTTSHVLLITAPHFERSLLSCLKWGFGVGIFTPTGPSALCPGTHFSRESLWRWLKGTQRILATLGHQLFCLQPCFLWAGQGFLHKRGSFDFQDGPSSYSSSACNYFDLCFHRDIHIFSVLIALSLSFPSKNDNTLQIGYRLRDCNTSNWATTTGSLWKVWICNKPSFSFLVHGWCR